MAIEIVSTTDSEENVQQAMQADKSEGQSVENVEGKEAKSKPQESEVESQDDSEEEQEKIDSSSDDEESDGDDDQEEDEDSQSEDDSEEKLESKPKKKSGIQKLKEKVSKAEMEAEFWREQALKGKRSDQESQETQEQVQTQSQERPNPEDFETQEDFIDALTDWKVDQALIKKDAKDQQKQFATKRQKLESEFKDKSQQFSETVDDWDEALDFADKHVRMQPVISELLLAAENGPELMYKLAKNLDEYKAMNEMPPHLAAKAFGIFESKLKSKSSSVGKNKNKTQQTKAPDPITTVGGRTSKGTSASIYDQNLSFKEYERLREKQMSR